MIKFKVQYCVDKIYFVSKQSKISFFIGFKLGRATTDAKTLSGFGGGLSSMSLALF